MKKREKKLESAINLCGENKMAKLINENACTKSPNKKYHFKARDSGGQIKDDLQGLEKLVTLFCGAKIMLKTNLNISRNLCNGSIGVVEEIITKDNEPIGAFVRFDSFKTESN